MLILSPSNAIRERQSTQSMRRKPPFNAPPTKPPWSLAASRCALFILHTLPSFPLYELVYADGFSNHHSKWFYLTISLHFCCCHRQPLSSHFFSSSSSVKYRIFICFLSARSISAFMPAEIVSRTPTTPHTCSSAQSS